MCASPSLAFKPLHNSWRFWVHSDSALPLWFQQINLTKVCWVPKEFISHQSILKRDFSLEQVLGMCQRRGVDTMPLAQQQPPHIRERCSCPGASRFFLQFCTICTQGIPGKRTTLMCRDVPMLVPWQREPQPYRTQAWIQRMHSWPCFLQNSPHCCF